MSGYQISNVPTSNEVRTTVMAHPCIAVPAFSGQLEFRCQICKISNTGRVEIATTDCYRWGIPCPPLEELNAGDIYMMIHVDPADLVTQRVMAIEPVVIVTQSHRFGDGTQFAVTSYTSIDGGTWFYGSGPMYPDPWRVYTSFDLKMLNRQLTRQVWQIITQQTARELVVNDTYGLQDLANRKLASF